MQEFYLFEAGATKTAFIKVKKEGQEELILPPYNPNRNYEVFEQVIQNEINLDAELNVIFYGAGLASAENKEITKSIFAKHQLKSIKVFDDIIGAARASYSKKEGVVCLMGTGGLAAYYNGNEIEKRRGGYGYLIDDLGGGYELGKRFVSIWLNNELSSRANNILSDKLDMKKATFLKNLYQSQDIDFISNLVPYVLQFEDEPAVKEMISNYFDDFIKYQVLPICKEYEKNAFSAVGSVGFHFYRCLTTAAKKFGLTVDQCLQNPIKRLVKFHL